MKKNSGTIVGFIIILILLITTSGCFEVFNVDDGSTTYVASPTKVQYNIQYGYMINCNGIGTYEINYDCDKPEILSGSVSSQALYGHYKDTTVANNEMLRWNISGENDNNYELGITATIVAGSFLVSDLNGENALSIQEIDPNLVSQYCHEQSNETIKFIDPDHSGIKNTATNILNQADSSNAFAVAKEIFTWLKQNTNYQVSSSFQAASVTFQKQTGDCDDLSFLYISLCRAVNIPARFIRGFVVEEENGVANAVSHAWTEVFVGGNIGVDGWIPVECAGTADNVETEINQNFGIEDASHIRLFEDDGSNESINAMLHPLWVTHNPNLTITSSYFVEIPDYTVLESKKLYIDKDGNRAYTD